MYSRDWHFHQDTISFFESSPGLRARHVFPEALASRAHPTNLAGRYASDKGIRRNVAGDDGAGGNEAILTELVATDDRGIGADAGALPYESVTKFLLTGYFGRVG